MVEPSTPRTIGGVEAALRFVVAVQEGGLADQARPAGETVACRQPGRHAAAVGQPARNLPREVAARLAWTLASALFVFSAAVQYNDPDPVQWMVVYGAAALLCALRAGGRPARAPWPVTLAVASAAWFVLVLAAGVPDSESMSALPGGVLPGEVEREALGLALVFVAALRLSVVALRGRSGPASSSC